MENFLIPRESGYLVTLLKMKILISNMGDSQLHTVVWLRILVAMGLIVGILMVSVVMLAAMTVFVAL